MNQTYINNGFESLLFYLITTKSANYAISMIKQIPINSLRNTHLRALWKLCVLSTDFLLYLMYSIFLKAFRKLLLHTA